MKWFTRIINLSSYGLDLAGRGAVLLMVLVVIVAICLRWLRITTTGAFELSLLFGVVAFVAPWAYTQVEKRHMRVDMLVSRLPQRAQSIIDSFTYFLSLGICYLTISSLFSFAAESARAGEVMSTAFPIPACIIAYLAGAMFTLLALVILIDLVDSLARSIKK